MNAPDTLWDYCIFLTSAASERTTFQTIITREQECPILSFKLANCLFQWVFSFCVMWNSETYLIFFLSPYHIWPNSLQSWRSLVFLFSYLPFPAFSVSTNTIYRQPVYKMREENPSEIVAMFILFVIFFPAIPESVL